MEISPQEGYKENAVSTNFHRKYGALCLVAGAGFEHLGIILANALSTYIFLKISVLFNSFPAAVQHFLLLSELRFSMMPLK